MKQSTRLVTIPERMATMRCLSCQHEWKDIDAATNQYPTPCPSCCEIRTEPAYDVTGEKMPDGWMWDE